MNKNDPIVKRIIVYFLGLFVLGMGVNFAKFAGLGISPVSSVPYALELISQYSLSATTLVIYVLFILIQILLLRKDFQIFQLLQLPVTFAFSYFILFTDRAHLLFWLPEPGNYAVQLLYVAIAIVLSGVGVFLYLQPDLIPMPPEGLVQAIVQASGGRFDFGRTKVVLDSTLGVLGAVTSLIFLGSLGAVREGTILCALGIGRVAGALAQSYQAKMAKRESA